MLGLMTTHRHKAEIEEFKDKVWELKNELELERTSNVLMKKNIILLKKFFIKSVVPCMKVECPRLTEVYAVDGDKENLCRIKYEKDRKTVSLDVDQRVPITKTVTYYHTGGGWIVVKVGTEFMYIPYIGNREVASVITERVSKNSIEDTVETKSKNCFDVGMFLDGLKDEDIIV